MSFVYLRYYFNSWEIQTYVLTYSLTYLLKYSAFCVTLAYSQPSHILSPCIFRTGKLFKTLWNVDHVYSEPCHRVLFSHIQKYSVPCATLECAETFHTRNPRIFRTLPKFHPDAFSELLLYLRNFQIFRTLTSKIRHIFRTLSVI